MWDKLVYIRIQGMHASRDYQPVKFQRRAYTTFITNVGGIYPLNTTIVYIIMKFQ